MERLQQLMRGMPGGGGGGGNSDSPLPDCAEKVHVSSLALLKMLKHGRAGVPMEVMGLMLGQFVDDYTINCVDVFAMPQSGTSVRCYCCCLYRCCTALYYLGSFLFISFYHSFHHIKQQTTGQRGSRRPGLSDQNAGHAQTNGASGNGGGLVPQSPRLWLLAEQYRH